MNGTNALSRLTDQPVLDSSLSDGIVKQFPISSCMGLSGPLAVAELIARGWRFRAGRISGAGFYRFPALGSPKRNGVRRSTIASSSQVLGMSGAKPVHS
jgi:hypothetical protein